MKLFSILLLLLLIFFQATISFAEENNFCLIYSLSPDYKISNELDDCKSKLTETNNEINSIKKSDSITSLENMKNVFYKNDSELVSCEKELISKIDELENLRSLFGNNDMKKVTFLKDLNPTQ